MALALLGETAVAAAQTANPTSRREIIARGIAARDAGDPARALALFREAAAIEMRPGLRMSIAQCEAALGDLRAACDDASRCVVESQADLGGQGNAAALQGCATLVGSACGHFGRVRVSGFANDARVSAQGRLLEGAREGDTFAVSPGEVVLEARDRAGRVARATVTVRRGETETAVFRWSDAMNPAGAQPLRLAPAPSPATAGRSVGPWLLVGAGGLGLAAAATFFGLREAAKSDRDGVCDAEACASEALGFQQSAEDHNLAMYLSLGVGAAAVGAGLGWLLVSRRSAPAPTTVVVSALPLRGGGGLTLGAPF